MNLNFLTILVCLAAYSYGMEITNWDQVRNNLHRKLEEIYERDHDFVKKTVEVGKYFKYFVTSPDSGEYQVVEEGSNALPSWLSFDTERNKLHGVPLEKDIRKGLRIIFKPKNRNEVTRKLTLTVTKGKNNHGCKDAATTLASVIFHANIEKITGHDRVKFLREFSHRFDAAIGDLKLEYGNRMDGNEMLSSNLRMAGPGDHPRKIVGEEPGFTVSWKLACGSNIEGHQDVSVLRTYTQREDFSDFHYPVLGWFVTSSRTKRNRRALGAGATPGATPSIQGTPTVIPSASIDVRPSVSSIQITPTKSLPPMIQTSVIPTTQPDTTAPPTTKKETTAPTTTTTTTTTEPPTTQPPTTIQPTVNQAPEVVDEHKFGEIKVQEQTPKIFSVPIGLFRDDDPLTIDLLYMNKDASWSTNVPSWIAYREERKIFLLPESKDAGSHDFALKAKDDKGLSAVYNFKVIVSKDQFVYNFKFNMTLEMEFDSIQNDPIKKVEIIHKIAKALGYSNLNRIKNVEFRKGSVVVIWSDELLKNASDCNNAELGSLARRLGDTSSLNEKLLPYTILSSGVTSVSDECEIGLIPLVNDPEEEESLWQRILIPVIVIVIILLIIALILCCVYRRKKKYETQSDKDESYMNQKKPVIFLEEYEEKPDFVSLKPLILPNEKPPVQGYGPRDGSPDGPESSTAPSTEDDENAPLAPKSPKETRGGYNAPPPYSAR